MPGPPAIRVHAGVENIRVARIGGDVRARRLIVDVQHLLPCLSTVRRLEDATLFVRSPLASEPARVHEVRILRVDHDARDLVTLLETDVRPMLPGVDRLVHPVTDRRVVARVLLARADVDDIWIARRDGDRADRADVLPVEDGL